MVRLFINNQEAEIDQGVSIPITFRYDNLLNPAIVANNFSKTVSLPATEKNNQIFNHSYRIDQVNYDFDAKSRVPFVLSYNNTVVESGYMKLNKVKIRKGYPYQYDVTLNGGLGDFFYTIAEKNMEDLEVNENFFNHTINADAVLNTWEGNASHYRYILSYSGKYDNFDSGNVDGTTSYDRYNDVNVVNFGGTGSDGPFQYIAVGTLFLATSPTGQNFLNQQQNKTFLFRAVTPRYYTDQVNPTPPAGLPIVIVGSHTIARSSDGLPSFRVYATEWNLFDVASGGTNFLAVGEDIIIYSSTGANGSWNPVIGSPENARLKSICFDGDLYYSAGENGVLYRSTTTGANIWEQVSYTRSNPSDNADLDFNCIYPGGGVFVLGSDSWYHIYNPTTNILTSFSYPGLNVKGATYNGTNFYICGEYTDPTGNVSGRIVTVNTSGTVVFDYPATRPVNTIKYTTARGFVALGDKIILYSTEVTPNDKWSIGNNLLSPSDIPELDEHQFYEYRSYYQRPVLRMQYLIDQIFANSGFTVNKDSTFFNFLNPYWQNTWVTMDRLTPATSDLPDENVGNIRSGDPVTYRLMMKKGVSQYDFMMYYLKNFGLIFEKDKITNTVTISSRNSYFRDYEIVDWTKKLDNSKDRDIDPLPFNFKYALFKWKENDTFYEKEYRTKYNLEYGEAKINTGYAFNKNEKNLIENDTFINGVISQEWDEYFLPSQDYRHDKTLPAFFNKNNNERVGTNGSMCILFYEGMKQTGENPGENRFAITDDTPQMKKDMKYYWTFDYKYLRSEYPFYTRLYNFLGVSELPFSLDFGRPAEAYYSGVDNTTYPANGTIYARYWKDYIEERYNEDNKVVTFYFHLTPIDINNFRFNKFVRIEDTLWHVNEIVDYDVTQPNKSTQVKMIRVKNIEAYTSGQYILAPPTGEQETKTKPAISNHSGLLSEFRLDIKAE